MPAEVHNSTTALLLNYTHFNSMLDTGPPSAFQIDGNFGGTAAIAEALLQSHETITADSSKDHVKPSRTGDSSSVPLIRILPAIPGQWSSNGGGFVKGLRARGGVEVDIHWGGDGKLANATLTSSTGANFWVTVGSNIIGSDEGSKIVIESTGPGIFVKISPVKSKIYIATLA